MPDNNPGMEAMANASMQVGLAQAEASKQNMMQQASVMELGIRKDAQTAQFQMIAWLSERMDSNSTRLQIALQDSTLRAQEESNRHSEAIQQLKVDARELEIQAAEAGAGAPDLSWFDDPAATPA